jgi:D-apiose dehydrogenase
MDLRSASGASVVIDVDLAVRGAPARIDDTVVVEGKLGTIRFDGRRLEGGGSSPVFDPEDGYQASYDGAIASFTAALVGGHPFETPVTAHLDVLRLMADAYRLADGRG